jgi:hypothetical protein
LEHGPVKLASPEIGSISEIMPTICACPGGISDSESVLFSFGDEQLKSRIDDVNTRMASRVFLIYIVLSF